MWPSVLIARLTRLLLATAILSGSYLYFYPVWLGCNFPSTDGLSTTAFLDTFDQHWHRENSYRAKPSLAPFRLLVLADPQLEGDSSLPKPDDALIHKLQVYWSLVASGTVLNFPLKVIGHVVKEVIVKDIPQEFHAWRKRLDLFGNDYYLAHIFRTLHWWTKPTHVTVLGDLIGSQWVNNEEFEYRGWRFWNRVFARGQRIDDEITNSYKNEEQLLFDMDDPEWRNRIINIAGNHDIGYAGDINRNRMDRFERVFGKANWDVKFKYPNINDTSTEDRPTLHMVVLNSMLLDTPAMDETLQGETYDYLNSIISNRIQPVEDRSSFVLFLTHVPQHKEAGVCVDSPYFDFFSEDQDCEGRCMPGGLKEQNHLSESASQMGTLETLFGMSGKPDAAAGGRGRPGIILDGHDHEGCDTWHYIPAKEPTYSFSVSEDESEQRTNWAAVRYKDSKSIESHTGVREVTLRSMMGEFGGNAGLFSAWYDFDQHEWQYEIKTCRMGIQHIWWSVHVTAILSVLGMFLVIVEKVVTILNRYIRGTRIRVSRTKNKRTKIE